MTHRTPSFVLMLLVVAFCGPRAGAQSSAQSDSPPEQAEKITILFIGDVAGEVASCGCKVEDYGGASRRAAFLAGVRAGGTPLVVVDAGGLAPFGEWNAQKELKLEALAKATALIPHEAVGLGHQDLRLGPEYAARIVTWLGKPVVATNYDLAPGLSERSRVVEAGGRKVGITAFLDETLAASFAPWVAVEPWEAERERIAALAGETDLLIALLQAPDTTDAKRLLGIFPEIDIVVGAHEGKFPGDLIYVGKSMVVGSGSNGKHLGQTDVKFADDGTVMRMVSAYLPVEKEWGFLPEIDAIVADYNRRVRELMFTNEAVDAPDQPR